MSIIEAKGNLSLVRIGSASDDEVANSSQPIAVVKDGVTIPLLGKEGNWDSDGVVEVSGANKITSIEAEERDGYILVLARAPVAKAYDVSRYDLVTGRLVDRWDSESAGWKPWNQSSWTVYTNGDWTGFDYYKKVFQGFRAEFGGLFDIPSHGTGGIKVEEVASSIAHVTGSSGSYGKSVADVISNYSAKSSPPIQIDLASFDGAVGSLKIANKSKKVARLAMKNIDFICDRQKGYLYYNENGRQPGLGDGGIFAILEGRPRVGIGNFDFI